MKTDASISCIIPVFNEERTILSILEIVRNWGKASEIIVVNDGSQDKTLQALRSYGFNIQIITYEKNRGKGYAVSAGVKKSKGDIILFLDGDITGLTSKDLDAVITPLKSGSADMVLGLARFFSVGSFEPFNELTGIRTLRRKMIIDKCSQISRLGYGLELFLNDLYKDQRIRRVKLPFVFILGKMEKQSIPDAAKSYLIEARDLIAQIARQQRDELTPQAIKLYRGIARYLKQALEYFG